MPGNLFRRPDRNLSSIRIRAAMFRFLATGSLSCCSSARPGAFPLHNVSELQEPVFLRDVPRNGLLNRFPVLPDYFRDGAVRDVRYELVERSACLAFEKLAKLFVFAHAVAAILRACLASCSRMKLSTSSWEMPKRSALAPKRGLPPIGVALAIAVRSRLLRPHSEETGFLSLLIFLRLYARLSAPVSGDSAPVLVT